MVATTKDALCSIHLARKAASLNPLVKLVEKDAGKGMVSTIKSEALCKLLRQSIFAKSLPLLQTVTGHKNSLMVEN